jgi:hypothetical protein
MIFLADGIWKVLPLELNIGPTVFVAIRANGYEREASIVEITGVPLNKT